MGLVEQLKDSEGEIFRFGVSKDDAFHLAQKEFSQISLLGSPFTQRCASKD